MSEHLVGLLYGLAVHHTKRNVNAYVLNIISIVVFILNNLPVTIIHWKIKKSVYREKEGYTIMPTILVLKVNPMFFIFL